MKQDVLFHPFPGLRPFEQGESHLFFGREAQSEELLRRLRQNRFLAVVGASGSGKSSLVRAGMLPALHGGIMAAAGSSWRVALFRPGNNPIGELARTLNEPEVYGDPDDEDAALQAVLFETSLRRSALGLTEVVKQARRPDGENLLVVVDQFEELFRFKRESEQGGQDAAAFVQLLLEASRSASQSIYVIITMRSDYIGDCAQFRELPETINDGQYLIPRLSRDQRQQAIAGPISVGGAKISPRLIQRVLNDVGDNPDQLPILQHALMRTWDICVQDAEAEELDLPHYEAAGGMAKALDDHAEEIYAELQTLGLGDVTERVFKTLTEQGADNRGIRRPTRFDHLRQVCGAEAKDVADVIDAFRAPGRTFLMPSGEVELQPDTVVDISHESLMRVWRRLDTWAAAEVESVQMYRRLADTAERYAAGQENLWQDPALRMGLDWRDKQQPTAAWAALHQEGFEAAMGFLQDSKAQHDAEMRVAEEEEVRGLRIRRTIFAGMLLVIYTGILIFLNNARIKGLETESADASRTLLSTVYKSWEELPASQKTIEAGIEELEDLDTAESQVASELKEKLETVDRLRTIIPSLARIYHALEEKKLDEARQTLQMLKQQDGEKQARQKSEPASLDVIQTQVYRAQEALERVANAQGEEGLRAIYEDWPKRPGLRDKIQEQIQALEDLDNDYARVASALATQLADNKTLAPKDQLLAQVYHFIEKKKLDDAQHVLQKLENNPHAALARLALGRTSDKADARGRELLSGLYQDWSKLPGSQDKIRERIRQLQNLGTDYAEVASALAAQLTTDEQMGPKDELLALIYPSLEKKTRADPWEVLQKLEDNPHAVLARLALEQAFDAANALAGKLLSGLYQDWSELPGSQDKIWEHIRQLQFLDTAHAEVASELEYQLEATSVTAEALGPADQLLGRLYRFVEEKKLDDGWKVLESLEEGFPGAIQVSLARLALDRASDTAAAQVGKRLSTLYQDGPTLPPSGDKSQESKALSAPEHTAEYQVAYELAEGALGKEDKLLAQVYKSLEEEHCEKDQDICLNNAKRIVRQLEKQFPDAIQAYLGQIVVEKAEPPSGFLGFISKRVTWQSEHTKVLQFMLLLSLVLVGLIWLAWQWNQRREGPVWERRRLRKKAEIKAKPNPIWRGLAGMTDLCIAGALGWLFGTLGGIIAKTIATLVNSDADGETAGNAALVLVSVFTFVAYLLCRDAIKYRFHRSIGKIVFRLRPVMATSEHGAITLKVLVKRNWILALAFTLPLVSVLLIVVDLGVALLVVVGLCLFLGLFLFLEFIMTVLGEGRTLRDRFAKTRVIHIRSEEAMAIDAGRRHELTTQP